MGLDGSTRLPGTVSQIGWAIGIQYNAGTAPPGAQINVVVITPAPTGAAILFRCPDPLDAPMKHLEPREAFEMLRKTPDALFVDCRSELEHLFVGHPIGAIQVTWNAEFVTHMRAIAANDRAVVLICRSGNRSVDAGEALEAAGFVNVYNVLHGFEGELDENNHRGTRSGWRFEGLPWEQC